MWPIMFFESLQSSNSSTLVIPLTTWQSPQYHLNAYNHFLSWRPRSDQAAQRLLKCQTVLAFWVCRNPSLPINVFGLCRIVKSPGWMWCKQMNLVIISHSCMYPQAPRLSKAQNLWSLTQPLLQRSLWAVTCSFKSMRWDSSSINYSHIY